MSRDLLIIFLKAARPGGVKTRIAVTTGPERACAIYKEMTAIVLDRFGSLQNVELRFSPDDALAEIQPLLRETWKARPQGEGDLGARLLRAFASGFASGAERVVIVGSDCPEIKSSDVRTAWKELDLHDVVVGPAVDGGYWLIGLKAAHVDLFSDISWSSDQVLAQTLSRAKSLGLRIQLLRILSDVDTEEDWKAWVRKGSEK